MGKIIGLPTTLPEVPQEIWSRGELETKLQNLRQEFVAYQTQVDGEQRKIIAAIKATVFVADLAGSAIPRVGYHLQDWLEQILTLVLSETEIETLLNQRLQGKTLRPFQQ